MPSLLRDGFTAFEHDDTAGLKNAASALAENAYRTHDALLVDTAVLVSALAKFLQKPYIVNHSRWPQFRKRMQSLLSQAVALEERRDVPALSSLIENALAECEEVSELLGRFHVSAVEKARVKIATDFYAHGASLGVATRLARADKTSVLSYVGATRLADKYETIPLLSRLKSARKLFSSPKEPTP